MLRYFFFLLIMAAASGSVAQPFRNEWIDYNKTYYKFPVAAEGLFRISKATLTNLNLGGVNAEDFQLWRDGQEQPVYTTESTGPLAANGYIEFYGRPLDGSQDDDLFPKPEYHVYKDLSYFSDTAWYYLTIDPGKQHLRFQNALNTVTSTTLVPDSFFMYTKSINFFRGGFSYNYHYGYGIVGDTNRNGIVIRSSIWDQGEGFASTPFNLDYPLSINLTNLQAFKNGPSMKLFTSVVGASRYTRTITVDINDSTVWTAFIPTFELRKQTIDNIPLSRITNDATVIKYKSDNNTWPEASQANALYLTYPHKFHFGNLRVFSFQLPANNNGNHLRVGNFLFGAQPPVLLDLTNLKRYTGITKADSSLFAIEPSVADRNLVLANQADFVKQVVSISPVQFTDYSNPSNQGDYLIITSKRIMFDNGKNMVDAYKQYRSSTEGGGFNVKVIDIEELYDQFSLGVRKNPLSIRHFIQYAVQQFAVKPKFILLLGRGVDYLGDRYSGNYGGREYLNSVPTWGSPGSDNLLAAGNSLDPTPLVPIGRISIINGKEIGNYLEKVKQYEQLSASGDFTPANKDWKKAVIQLVGMDMRAGPDSLFETNLVNSFMKGYAKIISDTLVGARVKTYLKAGNPNYANDMMEITQRMNNGVGLITYFGHSSSSSLNFNMSSPDDYTNTNGKYPVIIANGCKAGDIFTISSNRLAYFGQSISEKFILSPDKGAIGFISNSEYGLYNYLNIFTQEWMKSASKKDYGKGLGIIQQQSVKNAIGITGPTEFYNRLNCEQVILHGDPAVIVFPNQKPDYTVTDSLLSVSPLNATVAEDTLVVKAKFLNLGKSINDSVWVEITREFPDGRDMLVTKVLLKKLFNGDSVSVKIPVKGLFDKGTNYITATIDPANEWDEMSETNNSARIPFEVTDEEIRPVFPYTYAIVNKPGFHLIGSTVNPIQEERTYRLQVDTTEFFNSPLLYTKDTTTIGGAVDYLPAVSWVNGTVYYWRLAPVFDGVPVNWRNSSFQYLQGLFPGFGQSHYFQHTKSAFKKTMLDAGSRKFGFTDNIQNLYIVNSVYPSSGDEDSHFSIAENGMTNIYSACIGHSIIFNVFDTLTFKPWFNPNQRYGSASWCDWGREYNFEFYYYPAANRKKIMDFIDSIPKGMIVTARLILDPPHDSSLVNYWKKDTLIFGAGKSLYHSLVKQGFYLLDSMTRPRTFSFIFKKDDSLSFKPQSRLSTGLYDRLNNSFFVPTIDSIGEVVSPKFGPSKAWKQMHWLGHELPETDPQGIATVQLIGIDADNKEKILKTYSPGQWNNDISDVSAEQYPFLKLKLITRNSVKAIPYQLDYWRLFYEPVADGALSALDHYLFNKPILVTGKDDLQIELAFKNISGVPLDSTSVKITIADREGNETIHNLGKLKPLNAGDTAIIAFSQSTEGMNGRFYALIQVNKEQNPVEQYSFNNFTYIPFEVTSVLPVTITDFTAKADHAAVRLDWKTTNEVDVDTYTVEYSSTAGGNFTVIGELAGKNSGAAIIPYTLLHESPVMGINYYRLKITHRTGKVEYSTIRQINFSRSPVLIAYPNPFNEKISVSADGNNSWTLELFNAQGQKLITKKGSGSSSIDTRHLPDGMYLLRLANDNEVTTLKLEKRHR